MATAGARGGPEPDVPAIARTGGERIAESGGIVRVEAVTRRAQTLGHRFAAARGGAKALRRRSPAANQEMENERPIGSSPGHPHANLPIRAQPAQRGAGKAGGGVERHQQGAVGGAVCSLHRIHPQWVKTKSRLRIRQFRRRHFARGKPKSRDASYILPTVAWERELAFYEPAQGRAQRSLDGGPLLSGRRSGATRRRGRRAARFQMTWPSAGCGRSAPLQQARRLQPASVPSSTTWRSLRSRRPPRRR
jgi:hypothetical protein